MTRPYLRLVRRIVTGHGPQGRSLFRDDHFEPVEIAAGIAGSTLVWTAPDLPVDNNDQSDGRSHDAGLTLHGGSVIRVVDMHPGQLSPMHRTYSLDYAIVLSGALELEVDDGAKSLLGPGDMSCSVA